MFVRQFFALLVISMALPAAAGEAESRASAATAEDTVEAARPASKADAGDQRKLIERRRAELEGKLKVEQVLLKGTGEKGVEIEIAYRIVDVDSYAAHPKTTFIADEASSALIPLTKLHKLFEPLPAAEAEKLPPARLTLWDSKGVIKPGQPVTVVVAGYGQRHLIPVAAPDFDPEAIATVTTGKHKSSQAEADAELKVHEVRPVADGHMLKVRYSSQGIRALDTAANQTYIENPETGERHPLVKVPRIGVLAPKDIEGKVSNYMVIDNAGERIKPGQKVNVVVSGVRAENITVVEEGKE